MDCIPLFFKKLVLDREIIKVTWRTFSGKPVKNNKYIKIKKDGSLRITSVKTIHHGIYTCHISIKFGVEILFSTEFVKILIVVKIPILVMKAVFKGTPCPSCYPISKNDSKRVLKFEQIVKRFEVKYYSLPWMLYDNLFRGIAITNYTLFRVPPIRDKVKDTSCMLTKNDIFFNERKRDYDVYFLLIRESFNPSKGAALKFLNFKNWSFKYFYYAQCILRKTYNFDKIYAKSLYISLSGKCPEGYKFDDFLLLCQPCPPGYFKMQGSKCIECDKNKYSSFYGSTKCKKCPQNQRTFKHQSSVYDCKKFRRQTANFPPWYRRKKVRIPKDEVVLSYWLEDKLSKKEKKKRSSCDQPLNIISSKNQNLSHKNFQNTTSNDKKSRKSYITIISKIRMSGSARYLSYMLIIFHSTLLLCLIVGICMQYKYCKEDWKHLREYILALKLISGEDSFSCFDYLFFFSKKNRTTNKLRKQIKQLLGKAKGLDEILKDNVQKALKKRIYGGKNELIKVIVESLTKAKAEKAFKIKLKQKIEEEERRVREEELRLKQKGLPNLKEVELTEEKDFDEFFEGLMANLADRLTNSKK